MWPTCMNDLTPLPVALRAEPPADVVEAFRQRGWTGPLPVRLVALLGTCTTDRYQECPNFPDWHAENAAEDGDEFLEEIGRYYWCDFDLIGRDGAATRLRMAFNEGDTDCNDGTWGAVWDRDTAAVVANLSSVGDCEGQVALASEARARAYAPHGLPVPTGGDEFGASTLPCALVYATGAEFERLVGVAVRLCLAHCRPVGDEEEE
jgi:hypothetical protein